MSEINTNENITLEQIEEYIAKNKPKPVTLSYGGFQINIKTKLSIEEQNEFIDAVISNAYIGSIVPSWANIDAAFAISVMQFLTDMPMPVTVAADGDEPEREVIDSNRAYSIVKELNLVETIRCSHGNVNLLLCDLSRYVKNRIEFENQKILAYISQSGALDDTARAITAGANKFADFIGRTADILESVNEKVGKHLTPNRVNRWINGVQKAVVDSLRVKDNNIGEQ